MAIANVINFFIFVLSFSCTLVRRQTIQYMKRGALSLLCTLAKPDQRPETNTFKENAPNWTHLHLHAVRFSILVVFCKNDV